MSANKEKSVCANKESWCGYNEYRRPRYFHGMLLDDKDFLEEQNYHAGKRRLLNRMLHGSGVVCGLILKGEKEAQAIEVSSGLALDCCGYEIWVNKDETIPLAKLREFAKTPAAVNPCIEPHDDPTLKCYVGIRYDEKGTDPVAVYLPGAGCDERTCENSRVKEGYCFEFVNDCPGNTALIKECGEALPCPECEHCDKPCYVILGQVEYTKEGRVVAVTNECREYVITGRLVKQIILSVYGEKATSAHSIPRGMYAQGTGEKPLSTIDLLCKVLSSHQENKAVLDEHKQAITVLQDAIRTQIPEPAAALRPKAQASAEPMLESPPDTFPV